MPSDDDTKTIAELLKHYQPGFLPYPIFEQIARLIALPIIEFIPLRTQNDVVQVLLIERAADDPFWPGLIHTPGSVIRATDVHVGEASNWSAFERIVHEELADTKVGAPQYVGSLLHNSKRGAEQAQLYWVEVTGEPKVGAFYDVDDLPDSLIESQRAFIGAAVTNYRQQQQR